MKLIEVLNYERSEFIKTKGYAPDTLYLGSECEKFKGNHVLGMEIKIAYMLDKGQILMCRFKDLHFPIMPKINF